MKKFMLIIALLAMISLAHAKVPQKWQRPMLQAEPRVSLYIGEVTRFGFGGDIIYNPLKMVGFRLGLTEISFGDGGTIFSLNQNASFDALIYLPMKKYLPYVHAGLGLVSAGGGTQFAIRFGMGLDYPMAKGMILFLEPGINISSTSAGGVSNTETAFRLSFGAKFGLIK